MALKAWIGSKSVELEGDREQRILAELARLRNLPDKMVDTRAATYL